MPGMSSSECSWLDVAEWVASISCGCINAGASLNFVIHGLLHKLLQKLISMRVPNSCQALHAPYGRALPVICAYCFQASIDDILAWMFCLTHALHCTALIQLVGLADEKHSVEGRCDGLSVRFQAAKVVGDCDKHIKFKGQHADKHAQADQAQPLDPSSEGSKSEEVIVGLPGARRSLAGHHDKPDKKHADKARHHHDDDDDKESTDHKDRHHSKHGDKRGHGERCQMTFDDAESKDLHAV